jgi:epoxyqueuosine reductase
MADPSLVELAWAKGATFRLLVGESRLGEASPRVVGRNAAIALGNCGDDRALRPLVQIAREHPSPNVRLHAAWALGNWPEARPVLDEVRANDSDPAVRAEAEARLGAS